MRIIIVSTPIFPLGVSGLSGYGGLEQIAWQQARGLAAKGHEVALVAPDGSACPGVTIIPIGTAGQVSEKDAYGGYKEVKSKVKEGEQEREVVQRRVHAGYWQELLKADVIIDHSWSKFSYALKMEGRLKAPILGWMHAPVNTMYQTLPPVDRPCMVCISEDQRQHFEALHGSPARTCYNGIDLDVYKPLDIPRSSRFLFLARFSSVKGPDLAIEACKKAGVGLDLVGDTKLTGEAEYLQSILGMADGQQIRFAGPCGRGEAVWWYSQAHCLLHPNQRFREPFGLAPVEAMACGCPVIAWNYGAMRETVRYKDGVGWLVDSMEGLGIAINSLKEGIADAVRQRCREWASYFSVQRMVDRVEELCQEALDTGGW